MRAALKLLGKLARLLLAVEAQTWKQEPGIRIQALAGGSHLPIDAKVVSPDRHDPPRVEHGPVVIPASAPNVVVTQVPAAVPAEHQGWKLTAKKALEQVVVLLWAFICWAAAYALDGVLAGGVLEKLNLPPWLDVTLIYGVLFAFRDFLRRRQAERAAR